MAGAWIGAMGCLRVDPFRCQDDGDCVFDGQPGQCQPSEQVCLYPDPGCASQWSAAGGECMTPTAGTTGSTGPASTTTDGADETTAADSDHDETTAADQECDGGVAVDLSAQGMVSATSMFSADFPPQLAIDGDLTTSWFSAGIDLEGNPTRFEWVLAEPRCITRAVMVGNAMHQDPELRENTGYASVVMRVFDASDGLRFQRMIVLPGTPDPDAIVEPEVVGVRVELELFDHETFFRGGFSELQVQGY